MERRRFLPGFIVKTHTSLSYSRTHFHLKEGSGFGVEDNHMKFCHGRRKTIAHGHTLPSLDCKHLLCTGGPGKKTWEDKREGSGSGNVQGGEDVRKTRTS